MIFPKREKSHNSNKLQVPKSPFTKCNRLDHKYGFKKTVLITYKQERENKYILQTAFQKIKHLKKVINIQVQIKHLKIVIKMQVQI